MLKRVFGDRRAVLEIGSGTGQHAAYFAPELAHLTWQPSDVAENLPDIRLWREAAQTPGLLAPIAFDVDDFPPAVKADAVFSANTCHIMSWPRVERMFAGVSALLPPRGVLAVYGPFHYGGRPTSESNARFDAFLRSRDPASGVRDFEAVRELAGRHGLAVEEDNAMPANNRLLVFRKQP